MGLCLGACGSFPYNEELGCVDATQVVHTPQSHNIIALVARKYR